jgi:NADPH:quinone reductase-like Zn-dependent oxidoreductase
MSAATPQERNDRSRHFPSRAGALSLASSFSIRTIQGRRGERGGHRQGDLPRALFFLVNVTTAHLARIAAMIDAGDLTVNVGAVLPLANARAAHEMLEGSRSRPRGKIVLSVGD